MSAVIDNDYQTSLLFKRFTGVAATQLDAQFSNEPFRSITNIFSRDINIEEIPSQAPLSIFDLDNSNNWVDSASGAPSLNSGQSFADLYPDSNINFYKNVTLTAVPGSNSRVWRYIDSSGNNLLQDTINFKFDDINSTYLMRVKFDNGSGYTNNAINSFPLFWVMDNQSGYLQLYQTTVLLASQANIPTNPPKMSFYKYIGKKGLTNLDISGQQQVSDISGVANKINALNRMILPDGYVNIPGTDYDLCGNEVVRTNYTYNRQNMFVGYGNLPILDGSAVNHAGDPSHNNIIYELDVSGSIYFSQQISQGSCIAGGTNSAAFGQITQATGSNSFAIGQGGEAAGSGSFKSGSGSQALGNHSHSEGSSTTASGIYSHAEGVVTEAKGEGAHSEGNFTDASGTYSHAEGIQTTARGEASHSEGNFTDASGAYSHSEGSSTNATGISSHAEGAATNARGQGAHSEGNTTDASGDYSHAEGIQTLANTTAAHAEGFATKAYGVYSHTEGVSSEAWGQFSHATGEHTIIGTEAGTSIGKFNDTSQNILFVIGDGTSDSARSDALIVDSAGNTLLFHDVSMNGGQIIFIGDATDNSGVPSWGQVQLAIEDLSNSIISSYWIQTGSNIYYNTGNVGVGTTTPNAALDVNGNMILSGDLSMNGGQIIFIGDATDNSGVPSWGQVQTLVSGGSGSFWTQSGTDLYYNTGNVGIGTVTPSTKLDVVGGDTNLSENAFVSQSPNQYQITVDKNLYTRNTNLIDTLKIDFETFFNNIWAPMIEANRTGKYISQDPNALKQTYNLTQPNPGKAGAVPTFSSAWGPSVIPIAYLDINQNYRPTPFEPAGGQSFQGNGRRPYIANTCAYFTIKFAQPYDNNDTNTLIDWKTASLYPQFGGTFKAGYAGITYQTITFIAGYTDNFKRLPGDDSRKPKPFIKVLSTNIPNFKNLTGITTPDGLTAIDLNLETNNLTTYGFTPSTPKTGGLVRIIIAESCPGLPADIQIQNKAWLLIEQQWNVEPWQLVLGVDNTKFIQSLVGDHIIDVRMYANNLGDLNITRNPLSNNEFNTDWQLVTVEELSARQRFSWEKFVLPMGNYASPVVFNTPTIVLPTDVSFTLMVGGTECPNPITGILDGVYPPIYRGANLWEVWLNLKDWPYGITTTEEVFENNVDICGNLLIEGSTDAQAITATDITCNNLDALNSIDVGASQELTIIQNKITSTTTANSPVGGLNIEANNIYLKFAPWASAGGATPAGLNINLGDNTSNTQFRINNVTSQKLFSVEGSGAVQTQDISPLRNLTFDIGYKGPTPIQDFRYRNFYVGNIDTSGDVDISGNLTVDGNYGDISASNIDVSNNLNVEGLITGVAGTTFVEYRNFSADISAVSFDASASNGPSWHCIATTDDTSISGGRDFARGLFIIDDDTSGIREQIIFYAGTSYARGNYINVIAHNWYLSNGPLITDMKIDVSGNQPTPGGTAIYQGANLYIYRAKSFKAPDVRVRLYQNGRDPDSGGRWVLTSTPITNLNTTAVNINIQYDPNKNRANTISSLDTFIAGEFTAPVIKTTDLSGTNIELASTGNLIVKDNNTGVAANNVIDVDSTSNRVNFGGYDYTSTTSPIAPPTIGGKNPINRVVVDLEAGSNNFNNSVANSGSVITTKGGIKILPLLTGNGVGLPSWGGSLYLGEWGWGNYPSGSGPTLSQTTLDKFRPGSGNVYCNAIRQNVVFTEQNSQGPRWSAGYQGATNSTMYYNQGDVRYIIVDPTNGSNSYATVILPSISEPMLGQTITVARTNVPDTFANYRAAVFVRAGTPDRISCPNSIFVDDNNQGGIAIDPYRLIGNSGAGFPGFDVPNPYKGDEICSVTLVASQNGYYNANLNGTSIGGAITTQFVWQFISSGSPGL